MFLGKFIILSRKFSSLTIYLYLYNIANPPIDKTIKLITPAKKIAKFIEKLSAKNPINTEPIATHGYPQNCTCHDCSFSHAKDLLLPL